jgi:predicted RNA polymerase sigma factor
LEIVDALLSDASLKAYHLLPSVRGEFLKKLGHLSEARAEFERAARLTRLRRESEARNALAKRRSTRAVGCGVIAQARLN